ncbi:AlbA family DNA-binding domain-containing protein [Pseudomonas wadenswilerensis]
MKDQELIQELLYRGEGSTLDYKVQQYPFSKANEEQKSELLKDILAFSNAWRTETAYILIGIKDGTLDLVGVDEDIDDSRLQEFVNSKTNHPINFSYKTLIFNGIKLGLYTIPVQERPVYSKKKFGKVIQNVVYVRRGSATAIADPSEIAKMGAAAVYQEKTPETQGPNFSVKVVGLDDLPHEEFLHKYDGFKLLPIEKYLLISGADKYNQKTINEKFNKEMAVFLHESKSKTQIIFELTNYGDSVAQDVKLEISIPINSGSTFKDEASLLKKPERMIDKHSKPASLAIRDPRPQYKIETVAGEHILRFYLGKFQAGEVRRTPKIYLINPLPDLTKFNISVLSDQLRSAVKTLIPIKIECTTEELTMEHLKRT